METMMIDKLVFDNRTPDDLFLTQTVKPTKYSDVIKRWAVGDVISEEEKSIAFSILLSFPEYTIGNAKAGEFIQYLKKELQEPTLRCPENPKWGWYLYTLFYFHLKTGEAEAAIKVLPELEMVFGHYKNSGLNFPFDRISSAGPAKSFKSGEQADLYPLPEVCKDYFHIINLVMDAQELLSIEPRFNLTRLPIPPFNFSKDSFFDFRSSGLTHFQRKDYQSAMTDYQIMRLSGYEVSGTLIHMFRIALCIGNRSLAGIYASMAWRHRQTASAYVIGRTLFAIVFLLMLQKKNIEIWLNCLKTLVGYPESTLTWDLERVIFGYEKDLASEEALLLSGLLSLFSKNTPTEYLIYSVNWNLLEGLPEESWPEFDFTSPTDEI